MQYTTKEVQEMLGISSDTWRRRLDEILEFLKQFWDYEIIPYKRSSLFIVKRVYGEVPKLPRKTRIKEIKEFYRQETENVIKINPWNTGTNVARTILSYSNPYEHKQDTGSRYVRPILKEEYSLSSERKWCELDYKHNLYIPISNEQEEFLRTMFRLYLSDDKTAEIIAAQEAGYITKDEVLTALFGNYNSAMEKFVERYGFRPIKVGEYIKNAF